MNFKYFQGPSQDMAHHCDHKQACSFCGQVAECFSLEFAICPGLRSKKTAVGCFDCLRQGRFEFSHDTEIGELDECGLKYVHKGHMMPTPGFLEPVLSELRRTPQIATWQDEYWLTHCNDFMAYMGTWEPKDFYANAKDGDGRTLFLEMTDADYAHLWDESLPEGATTLSSWCATYYVFRCLHCGKLRGNWDCD